MTAVRHCQKTFSLERSVRVRTGQHRAVRWTELSAHQGRPSPSASLWDGGPWILRGSRAIALCVDTQLIEGCQYRRQIANTRTCESGFIVPIPPNNRTIQRDRKSGQKCRAGGHGVVGREKFPIGDKALEYNTREVVRPVIPTTSLSVVSQRPLRLAAAVRVGIHRTIKKLYGRWASS